MVTTWHLAKITALKIWVKIRHKGSSLKLRAVPGYSVVFIRAVGVSRRMNVPAESLNSLIWWKVSHGRELEQDVFKDPSNQTIL